MYCTVINGMDMNVTLRKFWILLLSSAILTPSVFGLQCHICKAYHKDGIISGSFCLDLDRNGEKAKSHISSPTLKPCNTIEDADNANNFGPMLSHDPTEEFILACHKSKVTTESAGFIERNCLISKKSLNNNCLWEQGTDPGKRVALSLGVSDAEANTVESFTCICNDTDGCNSSGKWTSSTLFLLCGIIWNFLV